MKIKFAISVCFILSCGSMLQSQQAPRKKALLIGVGNYPQQGGWQNLHSANDLKLMKEACLQQGFVEEDVCSIEDEHATRENIVSAIKTKLTSQVKKGDIVLFHFSGHGQQKEDLDGDEIDAYDECIVPYDSPKKYEKGINEGQKLITDDEMRILFYDLRKKLGSTGHLIVSLDACHSGTGTRGMATGRGTPEPMASPDYIQKKLKNKLLGENNKLNTEDVSSTSLAPMIAFFGSAQNQINYEMTNDDGEQFGSLSYSLAKHLVQSKKDESYRGLFDKIKVEMSKIAPNQQPQAEGDLDIEILNGRSLGAASYYKVISEADDDKILINGGYLQELNEGSTVGFFNRDTRDYENATPIAKGKISKSLATSAYVILDSIIEPQLLKDSWVYVLEKSMGQIKVEIAVRISDRELSEKIRTKIFSHSYIIDDSSKAKLIIEDKKNKSGNSFIYLHTHDGYTLDSFPMNNINAGVLSRLSKNVTRYVRGQFLRKLELKNENLQLSFQIVPYSMNKQSEENENIKPLLADEAGIKKLKVGDTFQIMVINDGIKPAYFNLLDLQPDNVCNPLLPDPNQTAEEMKILGGQKKLIPNIFQVGEPLGTEVFKLISSSKPLDLRSTYGTRGFAAKNPFEKLMSETETEEFYSTRGSKPVQVGNTDINIFSDSFIIVK